MKEGGVPLTADHRLSEPEPLQLAVTIGQSDPTAHTVPDFSNKVAAGTKAGTHAAGIAGSETVPAIQCERAMDASSSWPGGDSRHTGFRDG